MIRSLTTAAVLLLLALTGCTSGAEPVTPSPTGTTYETGVVAFPAEDGVTLQGRVYGAGETAVVLSNMGDNDPGPWQAFAPLLADRGYLVLSYSFRYPMRTSRFTDEMALATVPDLLGAVGYVRGFGASSVVLIGASLGGIAVGKVAGAARADAVVVLSSPQDLPAYGLVVTPAELAAMTGPKLFVASELDNNPPYADTMSYYENAPEPKQFHGFSGGAHGVHIFAGEHGDELRNLVLTFVTTNVPA